MTTAVIGAGVIGVSTALALAQAGHHVRVFEKHADIAAGDSHGNGAQLSYSYVEPFASSASLFHRIATHCRHDYA